MAHSEGGSATNEATPFTYLVVYVFHALPISLAMAPKQSERKRERMPSTCRRRLPPGASHMVQLLCDTSHVT